MIQPWSHSRLLKPVKHVKLEPRMNNQLKVVKKLKITFPILPYLPGELDILTNDGCIIVGHKQRLHLSEGHGPSCGLISNKPLSVSFGHDSRFWPNGIIFHQPRFPWNHLISLPQLPFGVRSCEVAIIWPKDWECEIIKMLNPVWISFQLNEVNTFQA